MRSQQAEILSRSYDGQHQTKKTTLSLFHFLPLGLSIFIMFFLSFCMSKCSELFSIALLVFEYDTFIGIYLSLVMYKLLWNRFYLLEEAVSANNCSLFEFLRWRCRM